MAKIDEHIKVMMLKGETGASIESIDKTASDGLIDTYTVRLTNGLEHKFYVHNGHDGKGITKIEKTSTSGSTDTYTITYTDNTTSTFNVNNGGGGEDIAIQRQIISAGNIESSTTATKAYNVGDFVVVNGVLKVVTKAISGGGTISSSNTTDTTIIDAVGQGFMSCGNSISDIENEIYSQRGEIQTINADVGAITSGALAYYGTDSAELLGSVPRIYTGTIVKSVDGNSSTVVVWSQSEFKNAFGRGFSSINGDYVNFMCGDANGVSAVMFGAAYVPAVDGIVACFNTTPKAGNIRLNYLVVLANK